MPATDYTYPSVYFAYLFFALMFGLAVYFFFKSKRDGYWGEQGEDAKFRMFDDDDHTPRRTHDRREEGQGRTQGIRRRLDDGAQGH